MYIRTYYFFRCIWCGQWYYSYKIIKRKKCVKCNRSFQFQKSTKFSRQCSMNGAIAIIKRLKENVKDEALSKYLIRDRVQRI